MKLKSKFPLMETTIFSKISTLAVEYGAHNFGQGFPNFEPDPYLIERLDFHSKNKANQYAPMHGTQALRNSIQNLMSSLYKVTPDANSEITITSGATEALFCAISALVHLGDEVIVFDPSYDSYIPNIELNGGLAKRISLTDDYEIPWNLVAQNINEKTKCIILNSPHNPTGKVLTQKDLDQLWELIKDKNIYLISDEVYQHIIFDNRKHISPYLDKRMHERTFSISSFGKTFHATGWKVGYCLGCEELTWEFRKIHQYITFCTPQNLQLAISDMLSAKLNQVQELGAFYQEKRDQFQSYLKQSGLKLLPVEGSYFQVVDYQGISDLEDTDFAIELIKTKGFASIPLSVFYEIRPKTKRLRLCFAKTEDVLKEISKLQF